MATVTTARTDTLTSEALVSLSGKYYTYQPDGLEVWDGKAFNTIEIKAGLRRLLNVTDVSDKELIDAHQTLFGKLIKQLKLNLDISFAFKFVDLNQPNIFVLSFSLVLIKPTNQ